MTLGFYITNILIFRIPILPRIAEYIWQSIALTVSITFLIIVECLLLFFGLYFVAIFNIYLDSIDRLNDKDFVKSSRSHMRHYHQKHLQILVKLKEFDTIFSSIQIILLGSATPLIIGTLYLIRLYPTLLIGYLMFLPVMLQFLEVCIFGEFIHSKTDKIFSALYLTRWYDLSKEDQMILLMIMNMTLKPFSLKAAGMYEINMRTFLNVTKFCFSFCAFLYAFT